MFSRRCRRQRADHDKVEIVLRGQQHVVTTRPGIYAAGDVTNRDQFVYMAAYGAKLVARNAMLGGAERYDNTATP